MRENLIKGVKWINKNNDQWEKKVGKEEQVTSETNGKQITRWYN